MESKQLKYAHDLQDYGSDSVYSWQKSEFRNLTPRSILKRTPNRGNNKKRWKSWATSAPRRWTRQMLKPKTQIQS